MLGMMIGVAAVIVLVAVGNGSKHAGPGADRRARHQLLHRAGPERPGGPGGCARRRRRRADAHAPRTPTALQDAFNAPDVKRVSPVVNATGHDARRGLDELPADARSSARRPPTPRRATTTSPSGAMFTDAGRQAAPARRRARPDRRREPLRRRRTRSARRVRIDGTSFQVVGVTEPKGSNGIQDQDDVVIAPLTAVQDALTRLRRGSASITVQAPIGGDARRRAGRGHLDPRRSATTSPTRPTRASRSSTRARCARRPTPSTERLHHAARRGRRDLAARRRDRRHEHHARHRSPSARARSASARRSARGAPTSSRSS